MIELHFPNNLDKAMGSRLKKIRLLLNLSTEYMAAELKTTPKKLRNLEKGKINHTPLAPILNTLYKNYGLSADHIINNTQYTFFIPGPNISSEFCRTHIHLFQPLTNTEDIQLLKFIFNDPTLYEYLIAKMRKQKYGCPKKNHLQIIPSLGDNYEQRHY